MDDGCSSELELDVSYEAEEIEVAQPERNSSSLSSAGFGNKRANNQLSSSNIKRSRRSVQKRVVSIPITEVEACRSKGGASEGAPPSDSWTWRKYGQKPIKGSPYPRGYYRCSSLKGCPARKQVERSREDPSTIVVTYSFDHNHNSSTHSKKKNNKLSATTAVLSKPSTSIIEKKENSPSVEEKETEFSSPDSVEKFSELIEEDCGLPWWTEGCSTSFNSTFLTESMATERLPEVAEIGKDEDGLFEGLEELPEWSVVFRRGMTSASWTC